MIQGRIQDLIRGGAPDRDRPKTAILGPQFCRILVLGPHFWWSGGGLGPRGPPGSAPVIYVETLQRPKYFDAAEETLIQGDTYQQTPMLVGVLCKC